MSVDSSRRVRTVQWENPQISARNAMSMSGLDYLRAIKEGKIQPPPVAVLLGYRIVEASQGLAIFELNPAEFHYNPFASVHGGVIGTLLDTAMTSAVICTLPVGQACSTLEMKVNFVRTLTDRSGTVRAEGRVVHRGRRVAIAEGKLTSADDKLCAFAVSTCMIFQADQDG